MRMPYQNSVVGEWTLIKIKWVQKPDIPLDSTWSYMTLKVNKMQAHRLCLQHCGAHGYSVHHEQLVADWAQLNN